MNFIRTAAASLALSFFAHSPFASAQGGQFVIEQSAEKSVVPIDLRSDDRSTLALAQLIFSAHGGFQLAPPGKAYRTLELTPLPGNRCQLRILQGSPARVQYEHSVSGTSPIHAVYRAGDEAVRQITGIPGFFAGQIAFVSKRTGHNEIWMGDLFFREVRQLTNDGSNALRPYLSPDGNTLFYRGFHRTGFPDVFKVDLRSGTRVPFASYKGTNAGGVVSPNNQQVALTLSASGNMELYVTDISGDRKPIKLTDTNAAETSPTWSPDGRRIMVASDQLGSPQLYQLPAQGGPMTRLRTNLSRYCAEPNWNPRNENEVIFTAAIGGGYQLALYDFSTNSASPVTGGGGADAKEAVWLNDGRHVLFTEETGGENYLVILDTETDRRTRISPTQFGNAAQPTYAY